MGSGEKRAPLEFFRTVLVSCMKLLLMRFQVGNDVVDRNELVDVLILDLDSEFVLAKHDQVGKFDGVDAEIVYQLGLGLNVVGIKLQFFNKDVFQCFQHGDNPPNFHLCYHGKFAVIKQH